MKKYLSILCALGMMLSAASCSSSDEKSSDSESSIEETTEETTVEETEPPTDPPTDPPTEPPTEDENSSTPVDLNQEIVCHDATFCLPSGCTETSSPSSDGSMESFQYNFPDGSYMMVLYEDGLEDDFDTFEEETGHQMNPLIGLEVMADALVASDGFKQIGEYEEIEIDGLPALKQIVEYTYDMDGLSVSCEMRIHYVMFDGKAYLIQFADMPIYSAYTAIDLSDEIVASFKFSKSADEQANETSTASGIANDDEITLGMENALEEAKDYLEFTPFSYNGLIDQLEYENYSYEEAVYAVDNCGADWNEQALLTAESYIEYSGFSYEGLIDQLEYEEFTPEQAAYGADNCGADWNAEAAETAESYIEFSSFSRQELIDQLVYEGFTLEQAEYGAQSVGY